VVISQWKMEKSPIFRLAMLQDGVTLVSAGRSIHCWNVETRSVVATFSGHTTNVSHLVPVSLPGEKGGYFLTAAESDRCISAWYVIFRLMSFPPKQLTLVLRKF
jgi:WD40 repeat protein